MKRVALVLFFVTVFGTLGAQDFCGHIKYRYTYFDAKSNKDITSRVDDFKTEDFYVCKNKFKVYFDGVLKDIFIGDSLTYLQVGPDTTVRYVRADSAYGQTPPSYTNPKQDVIYKGKKYNSIENNDDDSQTTYYYNNEVRIDTTVFRDLQLYNWDKFFKATHGGLRLISITTDKNRKSVCEAIEINKVVLRDEDFAAPKGYKIIPYISFEILD